MIEVRERSLFITVSEVPFTIIQDFFMVLQIELMYIIIKYK